MTYHRHLVFSVMLLAAAPSMADEAKLIAVLKSDATLEQKSAACRQLAPIATRQAVPALSGLLSDEKLSHMARYALETVPDPSAGAALRSALPRLSGRPLLGVIGSLGVRRDAEAVDPLSKFLGESDTAVAQAAARALGNIGTPAAAKALDGALGDAASGNQLAICEGLFRAAESLCSQGQRDQAQAIYDRLRSIATAAPPVRAAALRGAILVRGKAGIPLLLEAVCASDYAISASAARTAMELPGPEVTAALCEALPKLPQERQILFIQTLGYRGDASAGPALLALAASGPAAVRRAAVENLTHLGYAPALPLLAKLSLAQEGELAAIAKTSLQNFPGKEADGTILSMLDNGTAEVRALAVQMIAQRSIAGANARLLAACDDAEEPVRLAAFKALGQRAREADLPGLLKAIVKARTAAEVSAAEGALAALCVRESKPAGGNVVIVKAVYGDLPGGAFANVTRKVAALAKSGVMAIEASNDTFGDPANGHTKKLRIDYKVNGVRQSKTVAEGESLTITAFAAPQAVIDAICTALPDAPAAAKLALLRSLRTAGGPAALQAVRAAAAGSDPQAKETALRVLCDWNTPDALPSLLEIAQNPPSATVKILALRGLVRLIPLDEASDSQRADTLKAALALADRDEERRLVLSALGNIPAAAALLLVGTQLGNPSLREEACVAAVAIAEKLAHCGKAEANVLKQVAKVTSDKELATRAAKIARKAQK